MTLSDRLPRLALIAALGLLPAASALRAENSDISRYDPRMAEQHATLDANGVKWIDGRHLPLEGKAFANTERYYDRLPSTVTESVNPGVRAMKNHTAGMQFRFATDSTRLILRWTPLNPELAMDHMPATGVSGIDVYRRKPGGVWRYYKTGRCHKAAGATLALDWTPGDECLVNLPLYNGIRCFSLGINPAAQIRPLPPRKSGISKPAVFYGTSITHGGCASRPGLSFVNIIGRELDIPVVNLGFSGSGRMELEMSRHLADIDASCYVLDCLWNMNLALIKERYEPFIRNLRRLRPDTPIVMAGRSDVFSSGHSDSDRFVQALHAKLVAEGWQKLYFLPPDEMYPPDGEGTVDGVHPNDLGMAAHAKAYGKILRTALGLSN